MGTTAKVGIGTALVAAVVTAVAVSLPSGELGEMDKALRLVDPSIPTAVAANATPTVTAVASGNWSSPATWGGTAPVADDKVSIPAGISVLQDVSTPRLKSVYVQGSLSPAATATVAPPPPANITLNQIIAQQPAALQTTLTTIFATAGVDPNANLPLLPRPPPPPPSAVTPITLWAETLVTAPGSTFSAGTADAPYQGQWNFIAADYGPIDLVADPWVVGRGFIFMGTVSVYGRPVASRCFTTGNKAGDTTVTLTNPCTGWNVGDTLMLPGIAYDGTIDDDRVPIAAISADQLTVTLASPLKFAHPVAFGDGSYLDKQGKVRRMCCINISPRGIDFTSENHAIPQRGHKMYMRDDLTTSFVMSNVSNRFLGRTNKALPVTDPDGQGNGTGNPRARYGADHYHRINPDPTSTIALSLNNLCVDSPGWAYVIHDSHGGVRGCVAVDVFGSAFTTEIGTETGDFTDITAFRSSCPASMLTGPNGLPQDTDGGTDANGNPLSDFGKRGHHLWLQGSVVSVEGENIFAGSTDHAVVLSETRFFLHGAFSDFNTSFLPAGYTYSKPTIDIELLPHSISGIRTWGSPNSNVFIWSLNGENTDVAQVGRTTFTDFQIEAADVFAIEIGYSSCVDFSNGWLRNPAQDFGGAGIDGTQPESSMTYKNILIDGFGIGIQLPLGGINVVDSVTCVTGTGLRLYNLAYPSDMRSVAITNFTMIPLTAAQTAKLTRLGPFFAGQYFNLYQKGQQVGVFMRPDEPSFSLYDQFMNCLSGKIAMIQGDSVTYNGQPLYFPEQHPNWALGPMTETDDSKVASVPPILSTLTVGQMQSQYNLFIGACPALTDLQPVVGTNGYTSPTPQTNLPMMFVNAGQFADPTSPSNNWQNTSQPTGYVATVKDAKGNSYQSATTNLTDKAWNIVQVPFIGGQSRGVFVFCDSTQTFPSNW